MNKYCCDKFQFHWKSTNEMGLNFRIIKLGQPFIDRVNYKGNKYRYLITDGYKIRLDDNVKTIVMEYCPFCGRELQKYYHSDEYINEVFHEY